jgi:hypothetical protein
MNKLLLLINHFAAPGDKCSLPQSSNFLAFPHWYSYLPGQIDSDGTSCIPTLGSISDIWLIVLAVIDILIRVAAIAAVAMMVYGGIQFVLSNGSPDRAAKARETIINAIIGLIIAIAASAIIQFIAGQFS